MYNNWIKIDKNTGSRSVIPKPKWFYSDGSAVPESVLNKEGYYEIVDDPVPFEDFYTIEEVNPETEWEIIDNKCYVTRTKVEKDFNSRVFSLDEYVLSTLNTLRVDLFDNYFTYNVSGSGEHLIKIDKESIKEYETLNFASIKNKEGVSIQVPEEQRQELELKIKKAYQEVEDLFGDKAMFLHAYVRDEQVTDFKAHLLAINDILFGKEVA